MCSGQQLGTRAGDVRDAIAALDVGCDTDAPVVDGLKAGCVVAPRSEEQLCEVLRLASSFGLAVVPFGGATHLQTGNPPIAHDVAVSTQRLNAVVAYEPADMTVTVQAGGRLADLENLLSAQRQLLPLDPPGGPAATVGGVLAANVQGPLRHAYGTARDWVIGMRVAMAEGSIVKSGGRVVKNVTGYDLHKLHIGALGTLGVIVEVTFKLTPLPRAQTTAVVWCSSAAEAAELILRGSDAGLAMTAAEVLSPDAARELLQRNDWCALLRFGAGAMAVERSLRETRTLAGGIDARLELLDDDHVWRAWSEVLGGGDLTLRVSARATAAGALTDELNRELAPASPVISATATAGRVRATLAPAAGEGAMFVSRARQVAARHGGTVVVDAADPKTKRAIGDVFGAARGDLAIMRRLKDTYDPQRVLAPGRFHGGL